MAYRSLRDFIAKLEADGELVRVTEPVSTVLEMTEICTRLLATGGPAVLFEKPVMPVVGVKSDPRAWAMVTSVSVALTRVAPVMNQAARPPEPPRTVEPKDAARNPDLP